MSEQLLEAIIRLFALLARLDGVDKKERSKMYNLLVSRLNKEVIDFYMDMFDRYCYFDSESGTNAMAEISYISRQINGELTQQQKIFLISELTQLIYADNVLSDAEAEAIQTISEELRIDQKELKSIQNFVVAERLEEFDSEGMLFIGHELNDVPLENQIKPEGELDGFIAIMHLKSIKPFFLRYFGGTTIFLNQIPVEYGKVEIVPPGSAIRSDRCKAIYYSDLLSHIYNHKGESPITFKAENIRYNFKNGNVGLRDISISETNGNLIGVMGASGSGKSTLFKVLNGNEPPDAGKVSINGINIHDDKNKLKGLIGYVPQEDLLIEDLTVYQNLFFATKFCFADFSESEIHDLVEKILFSLGLYEIKNLIVGNALQNAISGGQRKRLNIGLELLREPMVLFVDEPTSGLSSRDSENIMDLLKELSLNGKLVFVVIHQPSSDIFKMFDKLFILDIGGYPIYYGNPMEAVTYFREATKLVEKQSSSCHVCGNVNAEQIFNIIEARIVDEYGRHTEQRKITPATWNEIYKENLQIDELPIANEAPKPILQIPGRIKQLGIFLARDFRAKLSNKQYVLINLIEAPLLAIFLSVLVRFYPTDGVFSVSYTFQDNMNILAYIFIGIIVALFMGLTVSAEEIIKDKKILKRESMLHLSRGSYLVSKLVLLFALSAIQTAAFVIIGNAILSIHGMNISYWLVFFSASCFANVLGLNISASFNSAITIYILIPLLLIPQILLSGVVVQFDQINPAFGSKTSVPIIGDLMASRWAHEALMVHQFKNNKFEKQFYDLDKEIAVSDYKTVYYLPKVESLLEYAFANRNVDENKTRVQECMAIVRHEIAAQIHELGTGNTDLINNLSSQQIDSASFANTKNYLTTLKQLYLNRNAGAQEEKRKLIMDMTSSPQKAADYQKMKGKYTNDKIATVVTHNQQKTKVLEYDGQLIQKVYPIYSDPKPTNFFDYRAMFYQPQKYFVGGFHDTFLFNVFVIWCMTMLLIVSLYFNILRKILIVMGKFRI